MDLLSSFLCPLQEVSLAFLLAPLLVSHDSGQTDPDTPLLARKKSLRRGGGGGEGDKRSSTPRPLSHYHLTSAECPTLEPLGAAFPWQLFRENHSPSHVITHYHPLSLDNYEYFVGRNTTTVTPHGYRVSACVRLYVCLSPLNVTVCISSSIQFRYLSFNMPERRTQREA